jgi:phosphoribosylanthranilate isomerase
VVKVKICGITSLDDALAACDAGADALGFVFAPEAKTRNRYIDPEDASGIIDKLPPFVSAIAVCVNAPRERLLEYLEFVDYVQLCGDESPQECALVPAHAIGSRLECPTAGEARGAPLRDRVIKAFRVSREFEPSLMRAYPGPAYLLDASVAGQHGGTGATCDWDVARRAVALGHPIILAGGLTPENVAEAVRYVRPYAVDTSGGVESAPGKKDHEKVRRFIQNAKHA